MSKEHAPLSRKEEEEKKAAEAQQQSGLIYGKGNATYNRMMNKLSPLKGGSMFKKKSNVSQPGDASELQADAVAKAVTEGNANAAQVELQNEVSSGEITAKASDVTIETPPGFEEQIEKMKGGGLPLPDDKKAGLEEMLGTDLDHVRLHTGSDVAELSAQINALAFATGDDIFYPGDLNDEELLAHEVVHTLQGGGGMQLDAKYSREGEEFQYLNRLNSPDITIRSRMLSELESVANDEKLWKVLLLAQDSEYEDVLTFTGKLIHNKLIQDSAFRFYIDELAASPQGYISDLAIKVLIENKLIEKNIQTGIFSVSKYSETTKSRLDVCITYLNNYAEKLNDLNFKYYSAIVGNTKVTPMHIADTSWFVAKKGEAADADIQDLNELNLTIDDLFLTYGEVDEALLLIDINLDSAGEGYFADSLKLKKKKILEAALEITGEKTQSDNLLKTIAELGTDIQIDLVVGLQKKLDEIEKRLDQIAVMTVVRVPLWKTNDPLDPHIEWQGPKKIGWTGSTQNYDLGKRNILVKKIRNRIAKFKQGGKLKLLLQYAKAGKSAEETYLKLLNEILPDIQLILLEYTMLENAVSYIKIWNDIGWTIYDPAYFDKYRDFADMIVTRIFLFLDAADYAESDPQGVIDWVSELSFYDEQYNTIGEINSTLKQLNADVKAEIEGLLFLMDILLIVISIFSMGIGGSILRGLLSGLSMRMATTAIGRFAFRTGMLALEGMVFHATYKGLRYLTYGEEFYGDGFWREYAQNTIMFGVLGKVGRLYESAIAPRVSAFASKMPTPFLTAATVKGAQYSVTFLAFQGWANGVFIAENQDLPSWDWQVKKAKENIIMLAAIHIGMKLTQPLFNKLEVSSLKYWQKKHDANVEVLREKVNAYKKNKNNTEKDGKNLLNQMKEKVQERKEIMRSALKLKQISQEEFDYYDAVYKEYINAINRALELGTIDMYAEETGVSLIYYRGKTEDVIRSFKTTGHTVSAKAGSSFVVTINGIKYKMIQSSELNTNKLIGSIENRSISEIVTRTGMNFTEVQQKFGIADAGKEGEDYAVEAEPNLILYKAWVNENWRPGQEVPEVYREEIENYNQRKRRERNLKRLEKAYTKEKVNQVGELYKNSLIYQDEQLVEKFVQEVLPNDFVAITVHSGSMFGALKDITRSDWFYSLKTETAETTFIPEAPLLRGETARLVTAENKKDLAVNLNTALTPLDPAVLDQCMNNLNLINSTVYDQFFIELDKTYAITIDRSSAFTVRHRNTDEGLDLFKERLEQLRYNNQADTDFYPQLFNRPDADVELCLGILGGKTVTVSLENGKSLTISKLDTDAEGKIDISAGKLGKNGKAFLEEIIKSLNGENHKRRKSALWALKKQKFAKEGKEQLEGAVYNPFLSEHVKAIEELNVELSNMIESTKSVDLVLSLDRGGTMIADQLDVLQNAKNIKIIKVDKLKEPIKIDGHKVNNHEYQKNEIVQNVSKLIEESKGADVHVVFIEEYVSGGSIKGVVKDAFAQLLANNENLSVTFLLLQQTIDFKKPDNPRNEILDHRSLRGITNPARVNVIYRSVRAILAEDVDQQLENDHDKSTNPFIIFDVVNGKFESLKLTPLPGTTSRDIIIQMGKGNLDGKLGNIR